MIKKKLLKCVIRFGDNCVSRVCDGEIFGICSIAVAANERN